MRKIRFTLTSTALMALAVCANAQTVYSNNAIPGDNYVNAGPTNQGQAVGASGWFYNNVRNNGSVGINTTYARSGNGSALLGSPDANGKADIEYLAGGLNVAGNYYATSTLGSFSTLSSYGYDWFRSSSSTAAGFHPSLRVLLDADGNLATTTDRGGLVFERVYNSGSITDDVWNTDTVGANTNVWNFGLGLGFAFDIGNNGYAYDDTLSQWQAYLPNATILGFSSGVGSGWTGTFAGAVDNINWTIGGVNTSTNFEAVPEPGTMIALGAGIAGLIARKRKKA
jgi:hypothetical protein